MFSTKKWNLSVALSDDLLNSFNLLPDDCLLCGLGVSGLRVGKIVNGDGKEDIEEDVVAADEEDDEVDADDLAPTLMQIVRSLMGGKGESVRKVMKVLQKVLMYYRPSGIQQKRTSWCKM